MEGNKDEALRCLAIAQKHFDAGNLPSARKFCLKSITLFEAPQATKLLASINKAESFSSSETKSASSSQTEEHPSATGIKNRHSQPNANGTAGGMGGGKRDFTPEQRAVVQRVRSCKATEYYEILGVKKDCDDAEIKKAYRKLALALHPDKNGAPGADEAFKLVSKAFQLLSDPQKRAVFDSGTDPDNRFGELSPEDLFNMFFGGNAANAFGPDFGGGPTVFTFGSGGFRTQTFRQSTRTGANANAEPRSILVQLLPLIILFGFSILSALPSYFATPPVPDPRFAYSEAQRYNTEMETGGLGIHYYVNPTEFSNHPVIGAEFAKEGVKIGRVVEERVIETNPDSAKDAETEKDTQGKSKTRKVVRGKGKKRGPALKKFEDTVERLYTQDLYSRCQRGTDRKQREKEAEVGIFGFGTDWEKVRKIETEVIESCEELKRLGLLV
ncbi:DnaJ-domain-containing protein [Phlegmacium glaucopus]|nr:DnaJ-domain-containing protein [Phlegmacium glaucopus]